MRVGVTHLQVFPDDFKQNPAGSLKTLVCNGSGGDGVVLQVDTLHLAVVRVGHKGNPQGAPTVAPR